MLRSGEGRNHTPSCAERRRRAYLKSSGAKLAVIKFDTRRPKIFRTKMSMTKAAEQLLSRLAHRRIRRPGACSMPRPLRSD